MYQIIVKPLEFFYGVWPNYAGAIALLTLSIMIVLLPLTLKGTRSMLAMQKLQPELKKLQNKYRDDRQRLNEEMMRFYKENNINPMAGCFPLLLQMPVFFVLYRTIYDLITRSDFGHDMGAAAAQAINDGSGYAHFGNFDASHLDTGGKLWQDLHQTNVMQSFGMNLAESASKAWSQGLGYAWPFLILVVVVASTSWIQQKQISGRTDQSNVNPQQQMLMRIMPIFFSIISFTLPAGIVVYFFVSNFFRIGQQAFITRTMYSDRDEGPIRATAREADAPKGLLDQLRGLGGGGQQTGARDSAKTPKKSAAGRGDRPARAASGGQTKTKGGGTAARPSRSAPTNANRSKKKRKRR